MWMSWQGQEAGEVPTWISLSEQVLWGEGMVTLSLKPCLWSIRRFPEISLILIPFENGRQPRPGRSSVAGTEVVAEAGGGATSPRWPAEGQKFCRAFGPRQNQRQKTAIGTQR